MGQVGDDLASLPVWSGGPLAFRSPLRVWRAAPPRDQRVTAMLDRRIATDPKRPIPSGHRGMLLSMKLLQANAGQLSLSCAGLQRLRDDQPGPMRRTRQLWLGRFGRFGF